MPRSKKNQETEVSIDAIELLQDQHREVEELFEELENTSSRAMKTRLQLVQKLAVAIEAHAQIEEKIFYPAGREVDEGMTLEAYEEHSVVRHLIEKLKQTEADDEVFMARVTVLKEMIEHHVEEEEGEYFPKLAKKFGNKKLSALGMELQEAYDEATEQLQQDMQGRAPAASRKKSAPADMHA
ncbi:MAG TPA: hemerythrin domain-containing protein [Oligoflexus sp.]|uniref:hemerythrin domain-containing protein n=1 Tax=Oligoflexus sp. TaxID=1971216 RepID=UPI002D7E875B|nr:hemerythrin domain-containing protein [Oligoflexus sp.]HET9240055.1 hemerythrin domain-containing protein [Oligoflexus sp.]